MRVSADTKLQTRQRILETARRLFESNGFQKTSTRDIATTSGIATGTLFNYFATKETLAMSLIADLLGHAKRDFATWRVGSETLPEDLFLLISVGLRRLEPCRHYLGEVIETAMSPFARTANDDGARIRTEHLEAVTEILNRHGVAGGLSPITAHIYWTLYLGVLAFWSRDDSPGQEGTLAVLDQTLRIFCASVGQSGAAVRQAGAAGGESGGRVGRTDTASAAPTPST